MTNHFEEKNQTQILTLIIKKTVHAIIRNNKNEQERNYIICDTYILNL